jgi:hypothetical protein
MSNFKIISYLRKWEYSLFHFGAETCGSQVWRVFCILLFAKLAKLAQAQKQPYGNLQVWPVLVQE